MKTARLSKREAKQAFRALRSGRPEKQPRSESKKTLKRAKAALKQSEGNLPRGLRDLRALQVVKDQSPTKVARVGAPPARIRKEDASEPRPDVKKARKPRREAGAPRGKIAAESASSDKQSSERPDSGALKIAFVAVEATLSSALLEKFAVLAAPRDIVRISSDESPADIAVHGYDAEPQALLAADSRPPHARLNVYLERFANGAEDADRLAASNRQIANTAADENGVVVRTAALTARYGQERLLTPGALSDAGVALLAATILQIATDKHFLASFSRSPIDADDLLAGRKLAETPLDLLSKLVWDSPKPPKLITSPISREAIDAFVRGDLILAGREKPIHFGENIDWSLRLDNKKLMGSFYGLAFLSPVLSYWYAKANGGESEEIAAADQCLTDAGVTASSLLGRAGAVLAGFANNGRPEATPELWGKNTAASRAKVQLLFLLCCRSAAKRRIRFDLQHCTSVFLSLLETLEYLRGPGLAPVASQEGLDHLSFVINLALPLRRLPYGKNLLQQCFDSIVRLQLDPGLTTEGVWFRGTFEQHCEALGTAVALAAAIRGIKIPAAAGLIPAMDRMTSFVESMLRAGKLPPPIDQIALVGQGKLVESARKIAPSDPDKKHASTTTHMFPRACYFVSHSTGDHGVKSSQLAIHAKGGSQKRGQLGRISIGFCRGESEFIVGGGLSARKAPAKAREASRTDLATGNEYRVNGESYSAAESSSSKALTIEHHLEGRGWAAAMIACRAHANALIRRTAIHLKPVHAFIMVDQLESVDGSELAFEQFWHLSPDLQEAGDLVFEHSSGHFAAAFNALERFPVSVERGSEENPIGWTINKEREPTPNSYLRRTLVSARGLSVSAFQWAENPASLEVSDASLEPDGWLMRVAGQGFDVRFARDGLVLRRTDRDG